MPLNTNLTTSSGLSATMQTFYDKILLRYATQNTVWADGGQKKLLPKNKGEIIKFRKWTPFGAITTPLAEGVVPDGQVLNMTDLQATVKSYGGYVTVSDRLEMHALDPVIADSTRLMGEQGGMSIDTLIRDIVTAGTNVMYANGKTARNLLAKNTDALTILDIRKARKLLKKNRATPFDRKGKKYYLCFISPDTEFDLQNDPKWEDVHKYSQAENIFSGEIGRMYQTIFIETSNPKVFVGAGASGADVIATVMCGMEAYGLVEVDGGNLHSIVKPKGSAGTADPLDQISTVGWKVEGFTSVILNQTWLVRIESAVSA